MTPERGYAIVMLGFLVLLSFSITDVSAHAPSNVVLAYDIDTQELSVQVSHDVLDPSTHYIKQIVVLKNDIQVDSQTYTSQSSTSGMSDTFTITAAGGDIIKVTATCVIVGSRTEQITVAAGTTSTTMTTTDTQTTTTSQTTGTTNGTMADNPWLLVSILIFLVAVIVLVVVVVRRRI